MSAVVAPRHALQRSSLVQGWPLTARLALRRSRWFYLVWVICLSLLLPATVGAYPRLVPDPAQAGPMLTALSGNPTMRAMLGPPFDLFTAGGFAMWRVGTFTAAAAAMMGALGVIRGTRAEEEDGRTELLRSGAIGRHAPLLGAVVVGLGACLVLALVTAVLLVGTTEQRSGALAAGLGIGLTGAMWVGVGALTAQLTESARSARSMALGALGLLYVVRAIADGGLDGRAQDVLRWVSPLEWAALSRPYADERWWVLALPVAVTAVLIALAFTLESRRDFGAGLRAARPGPGRGASWLRSSAGLAWRLDRGSTVGWTIGMLLAGVGIGSLSGSFDQILDDSPQVAEIFRRLGQGAAELRDAFFVAMLGILVVAFAMLGVILLHRLRHEEERGRAELMLSTATSRLRYAGAFLSLALIVATLLLVVSSAAMALPQAVSDGSPHVIGQIALAGLVQAPGVWLMIGLAMFLQGWAPRLGWLVWPVIGWSMFVTWVGALFDLPDVVLKLTPWALLPKLPVEQFEWTPVLGMTAAAATLITLGLLGWRRRDVG